MEGRAQTLYDKSRKLSFVDFAKYLEREWRITAILMNDAMAVTDNDTLETMRVNNEDNLSFLRGLLIGLALADQTQIVSEEQNNG